MTSRSRTAETTLDAGGSRRVRVRLSWADEPAVDTLRFAAGSLVDVRIGDGSIVNDLDSDESDDDTYDVGYALVARDVFSADAVAHLYWFYRADELDPTMIVRGQQRQHLFLSTHQDNVEMGCLIGQADIAITIDAMLYNREAKTLVPGYHVVKQLLASRAWCAQRLLAFRGLTFCLDSTKIAITVACVAAKVGVFEDCTSPPDDAARLTAAMLCFGPMFVGKPLAAVLSSGVCP